MITICTCDGINATNTNTNNNDNDDNDDDNNNNNNVEIYEDRLRCLKIERRSAQISQFSQMEKSRPDRGEAGKSSRILAFRVVMENTRVRDTQHDESLSYVGLVFVAVTREGSIYKIAGPALI